MHNAMQPTYDTWEEQITQEVQARLKCTYNDASAIIEANDFILTQCWCKEMDPVDVVKLLLAELKKL